MVTEPPSIELVRRAQDGEREALDRLVERYYERVRPIVRARLGARLRTQVDSVDILQETFGDAVRMFDRFEMRDDASLIQWLAKIAELRVRAAAQRMNAAKRDPGREVRLDASGDSDGRPQRPHEVAADNPTPSQALARGEDAERVLRCLDQLDELQREAILQRDFAGASWDSIAEALHKPSADAARMLHARALARLAALYGRE